MDIWSKWPFDWLTRFVKEIDLNFQKTDLDWEWTRHWVSTESKSFWFLEHFVHVISWILRPNSFKLQFYVFSKFLAFDQNQKKSIMSPKSRFCHNLCPRLSEFSENAVFLRFKQFLSCDNSIFGKFGPFLKFSDNPSQNILAKRSKILNFGTTSIS